MQFQSELKTGLAAVRQAAGLCRSVQSALAAAAMSKADSSPVTIADFGSQALICRALREAYPGDPVIAEEGAAELRTDGGAAFLQRVHDECLRAGATGTAEDVCSWIDHGEASAYSPRFWTLDPIDGTKGFLRCEQYAISLALVINGQIEIGILGCPNMEFPVVAERGVLAWAVRGCGAWQQPLWQDTAAVLPLRATATTSVADLRVCESVESGHSAHDWSGLIVRDLGITAAPVRMDSQCKYLAVARGDADLYLRLPTKKGYAEKIWDHAGGVLLVQEAGGMVTDICGRLCDFRQGSALTANEGVAATNGRVHPIVLQAISRNRPTATATP